MTINLSPSGLNQIDINDQSDIINWWSTVVNSNISRLATILLKIEGLGDTNIVNLSNNQALVWNSSSQEYENVDINYTTTTSSTTTSTT